MWPCLCVLLVVCVTGEPTPIIQTTTGPIRGIVNGGIDEFRGIPFAQPPLGDLRFREPVPIDPWKSVFEATKVGPDCPQWDFVGDIFWGNEDCLRLDVYVPHRPVKKPLPVYFWLFGGGWMLGSKWEFGLYDPHKFLEDNDFMFIAPNYRLGPMGFLQLNGTSGNMGLLDQNLALKWAVANVAAFGGDPKRITIGGESAGAFSVCWHLASPLSANMFVAAIMESGTCDSPEFFRPLDLATSFSQAFALSFGCNGTDEQLTTCLRTKEVGQLMSLYPDLSKYSKTHYIPSLYPLVPWAAVYGGSVLPDIPLRMLQKDKFNNVPLLIGTNANESNLFDFFLPEKAPPVFDDMFLSIFRHNLTMINEIKAFYNWDNDTKHERDSFTHILTDYFFYCATRRAIRAVAANGEVHTYLFDYRSGFAEKLVGDAHATEVVYVFGKPFVLFEFTDKDREISAMFHNYWTNMIKSGNPNSSGNPSFPNWLPYKSDFEYLNIQDPKTTDMDVDYRGKECDFWDVYANQY